MDVYRKFLRKTVSVALLILLVLSAAIGLATYPTVSFFGSGFDESRLVTTLSILLAGFCLARLLLGFWERDLTRASGCLLALCLVTALLVLPVRDALPFVLRGYAFPLLTGLSLPGLLSYLIAERKTPRFLRPGTVIFGVLLLLFSLFAVYGALSPSTLKRLLICRIVALPLTWFAPLFGFYAKKTGAAGRYMSVALGILPLFPILGILWETMFCLTPVAVLLCLVFFLYDWRHSSHP